MQQCYLDAVREADQKVNPLFTFLGARLECAENGEAVITLPVSPNLAQGAGFLSGGILATLADEAMAHAVITLFCNSNLVTSEMNIRYLRATDPQKPGTLTARAVVVKPGKNLTVAKADIHDTAGRHLATAGGTFWILPETE